DGEGLARRMGSVAGRARLGYVGPGEVGAGPVRAAVVGKHATGAGFDDHSRRPEVPRLAVHQGPRGGPGCGVLEQRLRPGVDGGDDAEAALFEIVRWLVAKWRRSAQLREHV